MGGKRLETFGLSWFDEDEVKVEDLVKLLKQEWESLLSLCK